MASYLIKSYKGGLSDYEDKGIEGSFKFGSNLNIRKKIDSLSCNQALADLTPPAETFNHLIDWWVPASDGNVYGFSRNGRIYKIASDLTATLVHTDTYGQITGAWEWGVSTGATYLFWATETRLNMKVLPGASNWSDVNTGGTGDLGTMPKTDLNSTTDHMMRSISGLGVLLICNKDTFALVGYDSSYTNQGLVFRPGHRAKLLAERGRNALFAANSVNQMFTSALYAYDGLSSVSGAELVKRWDDVMPLPLQNISAMVDAEAKLLVDNYGQVFHSDFLDGLPIFTFPGGGTVSPGSVAVDGYLALFGVWGNGSGKTGIYSYGRKAKNTAVCPNLEYQFDADEIGGIIKYGSNLLVSYKSGANYGVKNIDLNNKAQAVYESLDLWQPAKTGFQKMATWETVVLNTAPLPENASISLKYRLNKNGSWKVANVQGGSTSFATTGAQEAVFYIGDKGKVAEYQLTLTPYGNNSPEIYSIEAHFGY